MKFPRSILLLLILLVGKNVTAQSFEGVWKGTSLCQVKNSPCHDEVVVYYISKDSTGKSYKMNAGNEMKGTLMDKGKLYRIVDAKKEN